MLRKYVLVALNSCRTAAEGFLSVALDCLSLYSTSARYNELKIRAVLIGEKFFADAAASNAAVPSFPTLQYRTSFLKTQTLSLLLFDITGPGFGFRLRASPVHTIFQHWRVTQHIFGSSQASSFIFPITFCCTQSKDTRTRVLNIPNCLSKSSLLVATEPRAAQPRAGLLLKSSAGVRA